MTDIAFGTASNGVSQTQFNHTGLNWTAGGWHQIVLTYSPQQTRLYLDGQLVKTGTGVSRWPDATVRANDGFALGSNKNGGEQARGHFDELEIFNHPLDAEQIAADYNAIQSPANLSVLFPSTHFKQNVITGLILGGHAVHMATLIDTTDFANASWMLFSEAFSLDLGSGDGPRDVWIGLRGFSGEQHWQRVRLHVDTVPPVLTMVEPDPTTVSQPFIQIRGSASETLADVVYDLTSATGHLASEPAFVTARINDDQTSETHFQCFDVELAPGPNTIQVRATDLAGNVARTTLVRTLDFAGDVTPPVLTIHWPQDGANLSGLGFSLRGHVDDPCATLAVSGLDGESIDAIVERNGLFWIDNVPLAMGPNPFTLTATDPAGNLTQVNLTVHGSPLGIGITPVNPEDVTGQKVDHLYGTLSSPAYTVWINGVRIDDALLIWTGSAYEWYVPNVPLNPGGTAIVQARAIPLSHNGGNGDGNPSSPTQVDAGNPTSPSAIDFSIEVERPPRSIVTFFRTDKTRTTTDGFSDELNLRWRHQEGGTAQNIYIHPSEGQPHGYDRTDTITWPVEDWEPVSYGNLETFWHRQGNTTFGQVGPPKFYWESCDVLVKSSLPGGNSETYERQASGIVVLQTGGRAGIGRRNLFTLSAQCNQIIDLKWDPASTTHPDTLGIPAERIQLGALGALGADGLLHVSLPDHAELDITPFAGVSFYTYSPQAIRHRLHVTANGVRLAEDRLLDMARFCVGQHITLAPEFDPPVPQLGTAKITTQWVLDGQFVNESWQHLMAYPGGDQYPYGSVNYRVNAALLRKPTTAAWWINGEFDYQQLRQRIGLNIAFPNKQNAFVTSRGIMGMHRPSIHEWPVLQSSGQYQWYSDAGSEVVGGALSNTADSRQFWLAIDSEFEGLANWTQLCLLEEYTDLFGLSRTTSGGYWLDHDRFYSISHTTVPRAGPTTMMFSDSPGSYGGWTAISVNDHFKTFTMFLPVGSAMNIWAPLSRVDWTWQASARKQNRQWTVDLDHCPPPHLVLECLFPEWLRVHVDLFPE